MSDSEPPSWPPAEGTTAKALWDLDPDEAGEFFDREEAR